MAAKGLFIAMSASAALLGCAHHFEHHHGHGGARTPKALECAAGTKCEAWIGVECGFACAARVNFEVIVLPARSERTITWMLDKDAAGAGFRFAPEAIVFDRKAFKCSVLEGGLFARCEKIEGGFGVFKYTVRVEGPRPVPPLDPWVVSEF
jgi:hypothetical protein